MKNGFLQLIFLMFFISACSYIPFFNSTEELKKAKSKFVLFNPISHLMLGRMVIKVGGALS